MPSLEEVPNGFSVRDFFGLLSRREFRKRRLATPFAVEARKCAAGKAFSGAADSTICLTNVVNGRGNVFSGVFCSRSVCDTANERKSC